MWAWRDYQLNDGVAFDSSALRFNPDEAVPADQGHVAALIQQVKAYVARSGAQGLVVVGRTDSLPPRKWKDNVALSQARADTVRDRIVAGLGLPAEAVRGPR